MAQANPLGALGGIRSVPELWQKITFTFLCLLVYRIGSHVTVPGVDVNAMIAFFQQNQGGGLLGLYDLFVGGNLSRSTVFALGIMPYISASIFMQIGAAVIPTLDKMQKDEEGRKRINQWTRYATVGLAAVQGYGYALFTAGVQGAVVRPGTAFTLQMVLFLTTGALFVMWLGEQITERGLGNGASLLIFFSIVERFLPGIRDAFGNREEDQEGGAVAEAPLGDLLAEPHHEERARREEEHHLERERGAGAHDGALHARGEERVPVPLHRSEADGGVARPLVDALPTLFVLLHLVERRDHRGADLHEDRGRDVRHDAEGEDGRPREVPADEEVVQPEEPAPLVLLEERDHRVHVHARHGHVRTDSVDEQAEEGERDLLPELRDAPDAAEGAERVRLCHLSPRRCRRRRRSPHGRRRRP